MNLMQLADQFADFRISQSDFDALAVLSPTGELLFQSEHDFIKPAEGIALVDAWKNHLSAVTLGEDRYPILSWEDYQFAARNVKGKGALVGSLDREKNFVVAHIIPTARNAPAIAAILLNRWVWGI